MLDDKDKSKDDDQDPKGKGNGQDNDPDPNADTGGDNGGPKTFTQAEVDSIIKGRAERLARQMFPDYDDLKTKAGKLDELEKDQLSELEKAQQLAKDELERRQASDARVEKLMIDNTVIAMASAEDSRFRDPDLVLSLIDRSQISIKDGQVLGVKEAVEALAEKYKYLLVVTKSPDLDSQTGGGGRQKPVKLTLEEAAAAKQFGMTVEQYAGAGSAGNVDEYRKMKELKDKKRKE